MSGQPTFDSAAAHHFFSVTCFNRVWDLIEKPDRTPDDVDDMVNLCHASLWHWKQRLDCTETNLSVGYWQASRVYSLIGLSDRARHYAERCLHFSQNAGPFYLGFAHEALARSAKLAGDQTRCQQCVQKAHALAETISDDGERKMLLDDLQSLS